MSRATGRRARSISSPMTPHKLYDRCFLLRHGIEFPESGPESVRVPWEDIHFNIDVYTHSDRLGVLASRPFYHWRTDAGPHLSASFDKDPERVPGSSWARSSTTSRRRRSTRRPPTGSGRTTTRTGVLSGMLGSRGLKWDDDYYARALELATKFAENRVPVRVDGQLERRCARPVDPPAQRPRRQAQGARRGRPRGQGQARGHRCADGRRSVARLLHRAVDGRPRAAPCIRAPPGVGSAGAGATLQGDRNGYAAQGFSTSFLTSGWQARSDLSTDRTRTKPVGLAPGELLREPSRGPSPVAEWLWRPRPVAVLRIRATAGMQPPPRAGPVEDRVRQLLRGVLLASVRVLHGARHVRRARRWPRRRGQRLQARQPAARRRDRGEGSLLRRSSPDVAAATVRAQGSPASGCRAGGWRVVHWRDSTADAVSAP